MYFKINIEKIRDDVVLRIAADRTEVWMIVVIAALLLTLLSVGVGIP